MQSLSETDKRKLDQLQGSVEALESVIVAYSGGVDSSLLSCVADDVLGPERSLIVTANSPSMAAYELDAAVRMAQEKNWNHIVIETDEMNDHRYTANDGSRCFFCKTELYAHLHNMALRMSFAAIANGANADDLGDYRPGMKAAKNFQVHSPLVEAGISKKEVRSIAKALGLSNWNKPAQPCLSSRIPYGTTVTVEALRMVSKAEKHLRAMGFKECRVRHYGNKALVEVPKSSIDYYMQPEVRTRAEKGVLSAGYEAVELNMKGLRSGSLNDALKQVAGSPPTESKPPLAGRIRL